MPKGKTAIHHGNLKHRQTPTLQVICSICARPLNTFVVNGKPLAHVHPSCRDRDARRKARGVRPPCIDCGKANDSRQSVRCLACREAYKRKTALERYRKHERFLAQNGLSRCLCPACGKRFEGNARAEDKRCLDCRLADGHAPRRKNTMIEGTHALLDMARETIPSGAGCLLTKPLKWED